MTIESITLKHTLPNVFAAEADAPAAKRSQVWLTDLTLKRGDHYIVEAESGTGKSSMCSYIYGTRDDYSGKIYFDDRDIRTLTINEWCEVRRHSLAYLPQEMRLFPELTAIENVQIKNRLTGYLSDKRIKEMFEQLEIAHKADQPVARLSIGQQQRVAIIRALAQPFTFILLDEPVSHLDARNNQTAAQLIEEHAKIQGAGIISTSVGNPLLLTAPYNPLSL